MSGGNVILCGCKTDDREIIPVTSKSDVLKRVVQEVKELSQYLSQLDRLEKKVKGFPAKRAMLRKARSM